MKSFAIRENDDGKRVDKVIQKVTKNLPERLAQKLIRKGRAKLNGKKASAEQRVTVGDVLELYINDEFFGEISRGDEFKLVKEAKPNIAYEDDNIIIVDKPQGQLVHSDADESINTVISHITAYLYEKGEYNPEEENTFAPALCNRIDRNTAGLVIAAKNAKALSAMNEIIKKHLVKKTYRCIVIGVPDKKEDVLTGYLVRDVKLARVFISDKEEKGAKHIITKYKVIEEEHICGVLCSMLEVELETGRTHQIRAHLAHIGYPILGDGKYGISAINKKCKNRYQRLKSYELEFLDGIEGNLSYLAGEMIRAGDDKP